MSTCFIPEALGPWLSANLSFVRFCLTMAVVIFTSFPRKGFRKACHQEIRSFQCLSLLIRLNVAMNTYEQAINQTLNYWNKISQITHLVIFSSQQEVRSKWISKPNHLSKNDIYRCVCPCICLKGAHNRIKQRWIWQSKHQILPRGRVSASSTLEFFICNIYDGRIQRVWWKCTELTYSTKSSFWIIAQYVSKIKWAKVAWNFYLLCRRKQY